MSIPTLHSDLIPLLEKLINTNSSAGVINHLVKELGRSSDKAVPRVLIRHFAELNGEGKQLALSVLFKRPEWVSALVEAISDKQIDLKRLGPDVVTRLRHYTDPALAAHASEVIESIQGAIPKDREEIIAKFVPALAKAPDVNNGKEIYKRHCTICHRLGEKEHEREKTKDIGPDLVGVGVYGPELLLRQILDPNRSFETNYIAWNITTRKGEDYFGIIVSETKEALKVRNMLGETELRLADIASRKSSGISLMPEGYETLGDKNLRDVIYYLIDKSPKGYRTVDLTTAFTADSRHGLFADQADKPSLEFKKFGLLTIDTVPFQIANPDALPSGKNLIVLKGGTGFAKTLPQRVEIPVNAPASKIHVLGGVAGWGFPNAESGGTNDPLVRAQIVYADGETEEDFFRNGYEFADYVKRIDVPGSRYVPDLVTDGQLRLFSFTPKRTNQISKVILESFDRPAAPTFVAMTAQLADREK
jgi:putative heme-binding domain-containing protein